MKHTQLALGALFGFILSRSGLTDYDTMSGPFRLADWHLFGVIGIAVLLGASGFQLAQRFQLRSRQGEALSFAKKPMTRALPIGALLFGVGWAIAGSCPGTALAQIGEGRLAGLATFAGILLGARLELWQREQKRGRADATTRAAASTLVRQP